MKMPGTGFPRSSSPGRLTPSFLLRNSVSRISQLLRNVASLARRDGNMRDGMMTSVLSGLDLTIEQSESLTADDIRDLLASFSP